MLEGGRGLLFIKNVSYEMESIFKSLARLAASLPKCVINIPEGS